MTTESDASQPLLFISHKHSDRRIADVVRDFISKYSGGRVDIFQSSSPWAVGPRVAHNLNKELKSALWRAQALILIYTVPDQDWHYCMWECGVATNEESAESRLVILQCAGSVPSVFGEQVNINARKSEDIHKLVNELLTDSSFFPGLGRAITRFQRNSQEVVKAATELVKELRGVLPPEKADPNDEWPAYPFIQFELDQTQVESIVKSKGRSRKQSATKIVQNECAILRADKYAERLFGVPSFAAGTKLKELGDIWKEGHAKLQPKWLDMLSAQILDGVMWRLPVARWQTMTGVNDDSSYVPMMSYVRKIPARNSIQFDVFFYKVKPRGPKIGKN
jgi:hypothetical protein